ncbi:MAG: hypothetical protein K2X55_13470 [Burkholderiaceae bacterium]|nr:hypothetical protein [Burkholderiaceae bacterium]
MRKIEVDGVEFVEAAAPAQVVVLPRRMRQQPKPVQREFEGRMENWCRVVKGSAGSATAFCAGWAKLYVLLREDEAAPPQDVIDAKVRPLAGLVTADQYDGWLVEAAWRLLGDFNDRMALKCLYVYRLPEDRIRTKLRGVRGAHVPLVIGRAKKNLETILKRLDAAATIRPLRSDDVS